MSDTTACGVIIEKTTAMDRLSLYANIKARIDNLEKSKCGKVKPDEALAAVRESLNLKE